MEKSLQMDSNSGSGTLLLQEVKVEFDIDCSQKVTSNNPLPDIKAIPNKVNIKEESISYDDSTTIKQDLGNLASRKIKKEIDEVQDAQDNDKIQSYFDNNERMSVALESRKIELKKSRLIESELELSPETLQPQADINTDEKTEIVQVKAAHNSHMLKLDPDSFAVMERRRRRVTEAQKRILLDFLERNPSVARTRGNNYNAQARAESLRLWSKVAELLNAEETGTMKTPKEWSTYVSNYKSKLKKIVADLNTDYTSAGGGPKETYLSEADQRFLALMGEGFGQSTPWDPQLQQPSTLALLQTANVSTEEVQRTFATEHEPTTESRRNPHHIEPLIRNTVAPGVIQASTSATATTLTDAASTINPLRHTRQTRYRSRPLAPIDEARRILSQVKRQRAVADADAAAAEALNVIGQNLGRLADAAEIYLSRMKRR